MWPQHRSTAATAAPFRRSFRALTIAGLLGLAGCAGAGAGSGVIYYTNFTAGYVPGSIAAASPLLVETYGAPAPNLAQQAVTEATVQGLRSSGPPWMPRNYTGNPDAVENPAYVMRVGYGVPKAFNRQDLCKAAMSDATLDAARSAADANASRTVAGICRGKRAVAYAEGSPGVNPDITGQHFSDFVGLLGRKLMPRRNPVTQDDCLWRRCD